MTLARKTPLRATKSLERKSRLKPGGALKRSARLCAAVRVLDEAAEAAVDAYIQRKRKSLKRSAGSTKQKRKGPERSPGFLEFVRRKPCFYCGKAPRSHPHHFGKHGTGTKCSDFLTVPLCQPHHRHWHDHGTLPDAPRADWLAWFRENAIEMRREFEDLAASEEEFVVLEECAE